MSRTRSVFVLYTGGTFGMVPGPDGALAPLALAELEADICALCPDVRLLLHALEPPLDSSSVGPQEWAKMAQIIARAVPDHAGVVVIHGSDTLAYTASALSFMLENVPRPVVVTGSMRPLRQAGSDAAGNFRAAVQAALAQDLAAVTVAFGGHLMLGCRVVKMSAHRDTAFASPNAPMLGSFSPDLTLKHPVAPQKGDFQVAKDYDARVIVLRLWPGITADAVRHALAQPDLCGVILQSFGSGNAPDDPDVIRALQQGLQGKLCLNLTQCPEGAVEMGKYAASQGLATAGVISGGDMTLEAALPKMMLALGRDDIPDKRSYLSASQCGERSD